MATTLIWPPPGDFVFWGVVKDVAYVGLNE